MKKAINALSLLLLLLAGVSLLSGCAAQKIADKKGGILMLTFEEAREESQRGLFVHNADGTFSPLFTRAGGTAGMYSSSLNQGAEYLWYASPKEYDYAALIPVVTEETRLAGIFYSDNSVPDALSLVKLDYKGCTIGAECYLGADGQSMYLSSATACGNSTVAAMVAAESLSGQHKVATFNNRKDDIPFYNIDTSINMLTGLEEDAVYEIGIFVGTQYISYNVLSDTRLFKTAETKEISMPFAETTDGYFNVKLPDLTPGYYYIQNYGMFEYKEAAAQ